MCRDDRIDPTTDWRPAQDQQVAYPAPDATSPYLRHGMYSVWLPNPPGLLTDQVRNYIVEGWYETPEVGALLSIVTDAGRILELGGGPVFLSAAVASRLEPADYRVFEADPKLIKFIHDTHDMNEIEGVEVTNAILTSDPAELDAGAGEFSATEAF